MSSGKKYYFQNNTFANFAHLKFDAIFVVVGMRHEFLKHQFSTVAKVLMNILHSIVIAFLRLMRYRVIAFFI